MPLTLRRTAAVTLSTALLAAGAVVAAAPSSAQQAPRLGISVSPDTITAGQEAVAQIRGTAGLAVELYAYSRPSTTYRLVRQGTIPSDGSLELPVRPGTNTRLFAAVSNQRGNESIAVVLNVQSALSLSVRRTGTRTYVFEGRILPRNQTTKVQVFRLDAAGREILTAEATTNPSADGLYRVTRTFTGTGTFDFVTRSVRTPNNAPGVSNVRRVAIS